MSSVDGNVPSEPRTPTYLDITYADGITQRYDARRVALGSSGDTYLGRVSGKNLEWQVAHALQNGQPWLILKKPTRESDVEKIINSAQIRSVNIVETPAPKSGSGRK